MAHLYPYPYKTLPNIGVLTCSGLEIQTVSILTQDPPPDEYSLILPNDAGSSGQVLSTDGTGLLSWVSIPPPNPGTVTSVSAAVPSFLSVSVTNPTTTPIINITYSGSALPITSGGTGLISVGTNGQVLTSNGSAIVWTTPTVGTVTSVSASVPSWLSVTVTNATTTPNIAITGTATGTGTVTVLQNSPTITTDLTINGNNSPTLKISRTSGNGKAVEIHNSQAAPQENWIEIGHDNGNIHNRALFGHNYLANNSNTNYAYIEAGGNQLQWDGNYTLSAQDMTINLNSDLKMNNDIVMNSTGATITMNDTSGTFSRIVFTGNNPTFVNLGLAGFTGGTTFEIRANQGLVYIRPKLDFRVTNQTDFTTLLFSGGANFTFPTVQATAGQFLTNDGTGVTSWTNAIASISVTSPITSTGGSNPTIALGTVPTTLGGTGLTTVGTTGQVLTSNGTSLSWQTPSGGTVTSVSAASPLASSGGTTPTISIASYTGSGGVVLNSNPTIDGQIFISAVAANTGFLKLTSIGNANYIQSGLQFTNSSTAPLVFSDINYSNEWMRITATGLVGIGTSTPAQKFSVTNGRIRIDDPNNGVLELKTNANISYAYTDSNGFFNLASTVNRTIVNGQLNTTTRGTFGSSSAGGSVLNVGDASLDTARYGSFQITQDFATIINTANIVAAITCVSSGNYTWGIGYKQGSNTFGFGPGVLAGFSPFKFCITPAGAVGVGTDSPAFDFDINMGGIPTFAVRSGFNGGFHTQWNYSGGVGETIFFNYRGGGPGSFWFKNKNTSNVDVGWSPIQCGNGWFNGSVDINGNGEVLKLRGTDHVYTRYLLNGVNKAYTGFGGAGSTVFDIVNQNSTVAGFCFAFYGATTAALSRMYNTWDYGYATINFATNAWNVDVGLGGTSEPSGLLQNKFYIYQNGYAIVINQSSNTGLGTTSPTQKLDVNGNIRTRSSFTSNDVTFFQYDEYNYSANFSMDIGGLDSTNNNFYLYNVGVGQAFSALTYNIRSCMITKIGRMVTVALDLAWTFTLNSPVPSANQSMAIRFSNSANWRPTNVAGYAVGTRGISYVVGANTLGSPYTYVLGGCVDNATGTNVVVIYMYDQGGNTWKWNSNYFAGSSYYNRIFLNMTYNI